MHRFRLTSGPWMNSPVAKIVLSLGIPWQVRVSSRQMREVWAMVVSVVVVTLTTTMGLASPTTTPPSLPASFPATLTTDTSLACDPGTAHAMSVIAEPPPEQVEQSELEQSYSFGTVPGMTMFVTVATSQPAGTKSTAELCSEADDPRCQLKQGDTSSASNWPKLQVRAAEPPSDPFAALRRVDAPGLFLNNAPSDSGVQRSLFRPPRSSL